MGQVDIFSIMYPKYKIVKSIRLIELFSGYGSQAIALKYLGVKFEHYKVVEFDKYAIQSYNEIHETNFETLDITETSAKDLEIVDTDKYDYIMTYSFPCQDLSLAGKRAGMSNTSTRSGLLWEVERILDECTELPQVLLMENVTQVIGTGNVEHFNKWQYKLESLGYKNYHQNLIATDYGIPQTRNRTFMISILGEYSYTFPKEIPLELKLKDLLEIEVDEKYYLSENAIKGMFETDYQQGRYENRVQKDVCSTIMARDYKDAKCVEVFDFRYDEGIRGRVDTEMCPTITCKTGSSGISGQPLLKIPEATKKGYAEAYEGDSINLEQPNSKTRRGRVGKGVAQTLMTNPQQAVISYGIATNESKEWQKQPLEELSRTLLSNKSNSGVGVIENNLRIRKLTPKECFRLMGVKDEDYEKITCSNAQKYKQAGNSIVVNVLMAIFKEMLGVD